MEEHSSLLRLVRAVSVLDGVDADPTSDGVLVTRGRTTPPIPWAEIADLLGPDDPLARAPRLRLCILLVLHRQVAVLAGMAAAALRAAARPLALPVRHPLHPGPVWVRERVPGGVLDLGIGLTGLLPGDDVLPLPASVAAAAGLPVHPVGTIEGLQWPEVRAVGDRPADLAIARLIHLDERPPVLMGIGGVDALTLLALPAVRRHLSGPAAAPTRDRAWIGARATDEAYLRAVWTLTTVGRRGIAEPLAVDEAGVVPLRPAQRSGSSPIGS